MKTTLRVLRFNGRKATTPPPVKHPAEEGVRWLAEHKPHALKIIAKIIFDVIDNEYDSRQHNNPELARRLRKELDRLEFQRKRREYQQTYGTEPEA